MLPSRSGGRGVPAASIIIHRGNEFERKRKYPTFVSNDCWKHCRLDPGERSPGSPPHFQQSGRHVPQPG
jgi:hypothetical protein